MLVLFMLSFLCLKSFNALEPCLVIGGVERRDFILLLFCFLFSMQIQGTCSRISICLLLFV